MEIYLVGGAVRDALLNRPVKDRDWLVVGARPDDLLNQGYLSVGADFPVFLHPESKEEYALARTERKSGKGHTGFICDASASVTLEQDLLRRDLTINAIAQDADGKLHDPYGGCADLDARLLRHVSLAFAEDPLRVLRVARFAARYHSLGFVVADETMMLMQTMARTGDLANLTAERIWQELSRALMEPSPEVFVRTLRDCGALKQILPELDALFGVPQPEQHHPEIDTGEHLLLALQQAVKLGLNEPARFAVLCHDLGKGTTEPSDWPRHIGHEARSATLADELCKRLRTPREHRDTAVLVAEYHTHVHRALELTPKKLLKLMNRFDVLRRPERLPDILGACEADARGRTGFEDRAYPQADYLSAAFTACQQVDIAALQAKEYTGAAMGEAIYRERLQLLKNWKAEADAR